MISYFVCRFIESLDWLSDTSLETVKNQVGKHTALKSHLTPIIASSYEYSKAAFIK